MVLQPDQLASLDFLGDELLFEADGTRREDMARHLYMHAFYGHDLAPYVERLRGFSSTAAATTMLVGKALAVHAYNVDDGALVTALLAGPQRLQVLQVDHRKRVGAASVHALVAFAASAAPADQQLAFRALHRLAAYGTDLQPGLAVFCDALGARPSGRGTKKVDVDAVARAALSTLDRALVVAELTRCAATSKGAKAYLDQLTAG